MEQLALIHDEKCRGRGAWCWGPLAVAGALLAVLAASGANRSLFLALNNNLQWPGPVLWSSVTILGDTLVAAVLMFPLVRRRPDILWALLCATLVATLFTRGLKPLCDVARPAGVLSRELFSIIGPAHRRHAFPSGHTITAFTIAGTLALSLTRVWLRAALLGAASLIGLSRIVTGVHWPADVLAGAALGWLAALAGVRFAAWRHPRRYRLLQVCCAAVLSVACVVLATVYRTRYEEALWLQRGIAALCLLWGLWETIRIFNVHTQDAVSGKEQV